MFIIIVIITIIFLVVVPHCVMTTFNLEQNLTLFLFGTMINTCIKHEQDWKGVFFGVS
jgi:hypothetical protein